MAIKWHLDEVLQQRDVTLNELSLKVNISVYDLNNIKTGSVTVLRMATLEHICNALHCQPGDLMEITEEKQ